MHKTEWCEARRAFIEEYFEPITGTRFESRDGTSKESSMPPKCVA
jgi:hypothetical protein